MTASASSTSVPATPRPPRPGLLDEQQIDELVAGIHANSGGGSLRATGAAASNLDLYQVNCTYYDALGGDDEALLVARLVQLFLPGIPQVYYVGLLAGHNDLDLLADDRRRARREPGPADARGPRLGGRPARRPPSARRHRPAVAASSLRGRLRLRPRGTALTLAWTTDADDVTLTVDFSTRGFVIRSRGEVVELSHHRPAGPRA